MVFVLYLFFVIAVLFKNHSDGGEKRRSDKYRDKKNRVLARFF